MFWLFIHNNGDYIMRSDFVRFTSRFLMFFFLSIHLAAYAVADGETLVQQVNSSGLDAIGNVIAGEINLDQPNGSGLTLLMAAVDAGNLEVAKLLLEKGASVNKVSHYPNSNDKLKSDEKLSMAESLRATSGTALSLAALKGDYAMVAMLLAYGADTNIQTTINMYDFAIKNGLLNYELTPDKKQILLNTVVVSYSPLVCAIYGKNIKVIELLMEKGAIDATIKANKLALFLARHTIKEDNNPVFTKLLLEDKFVEYSTAFGNIELNGFWLADIDTNNNLFLVKGAKGSSEVSINMADIVCLFILKHKTAPDQKTMQTMEAMFKHLQELANIPALTLSSFFIYCSNLSDKRNISKKEAQTLLSDIINTGVDVDAGITVNVLALDVLAVFATCDLTTIDMFFNKLSTSPNIINARVVSISSLALLSANEQLKSDEALNMLLQKKAKKDSAINIALSPLGIYFLSAIGVLNFKECLDQGLIVGMDGYKENIQQLVNQGAFLSTDISAKVPVSKVISSAIELANCKQDLGKIISTLLSFTEEDTVSLKVGSFIPNLYSGIFSAFFAEKTDCSTMANNYFAATAEALKNYDPNKSDYMIDLNLDPSKMKMSLLMDLSSIVAFAKDKKPLN